MGTVVGQTLMERARAHGCPSVGSVGIISPYADQVPPSSLI